MFFLLELKLWSPQSLIIIFIKRFTCSVCSGLITEDFCVEEAFVLKAQCFKYMHPLLYLKILLYTFLYENE